jgi:hypothetical protein
MEKSVKSKIILFLGITFLSPEHQKRPKKPYLSLLGNSDLGPRIK